MQYKAACVREGIMLLYKKHYRRVRLALREQSYLAYKYIARANKFYCISYLIIPIIICMQDNFSHACDQSSGLTSSIRPSALAKTRPRHIHVNNGHEDGAGVMGKNWGKWGRISWRIWLYQSTNFPISPKNYSSY